MITLSLFGSSAMRRLDKKSKTKNRSSNFPKRKKIPGLKKMPKTLIHKPKTKQIKLLKNTLKRTKSTARLKLNKLRNSRNSPKLTSKNYEKNRKDSNKWQ
jgi:hypothetical protein